MTRWASSEHAAVRPAPYRVDRGAALRAVRATQRRQLLVTAADVFARRGYHAAQMSEIAERSGMSKPTVYKHFSGKLDLYLAVLQARLDRLVAGITQAVQTSGDNAVRARGAVKVYFDFIDLDPDGFRLVFETEVPSEPSVRLRIDRELDNCVRTTADLLARETGTDLFRARMLAAGLIGICRFTARQWLDAGRPIPKDQAIAATALLCARGLSGVPLVRRLPENAAAFPAR
ncbi:TetR/AcrR family transcriptional regulator [Nocardia sp. NPDC048505]|uniref:TetR/AcrR family transcriptional regulator n=1 Tax=unclassified Nocardia TaxID=2637762 RepID=UPI0033F2ED32